MSLDGFIARTNDDIDWLEDLPSNVGHVTTSAEHPALVWETFFPEIDTLVMGRGTYEKVLTFQDWPFPDLPVVVLSRTLGADDPRIVVVPSVQEAVSRLTASGAQQVYVDGGKTVQEFLRQGLLDELTVSVAPILLGNGKSLFADFGRDIILTVRGSHVTDEGLVRISYDIDQPKN